MIRRTPITYEMRISQYLRGPDALTDNHQGVQVSALLKLSE